MDSPSPTESDPDSQTFRLEKDWGMTCDEWQKFEDKLNFLGREPSESVAIIVDVPSSLEDDEGLYRLGYLTRQSIDRLETGKADVGVFLRPCVSHMEEIEIVLDAKILQKQDLDRYNWICFVGIGDVIHPSLLTHVSQSESDVVIFDQVFECNNRCFPMFFGPFDPIKSESCDYLNGRFVLRSKLARHVDKIPPIEILRGLNRSLTSEHVALPLIKATGKPSSMVEKASFFKPLVGKGKLVKDSTVTVIVSTKNAARILAHTLPVMHEHDQVAEIIIVSNQTDNPYSLALLERLGKLEKISIIYYNENFNFSKQSNIAAEASKSKNLVFFNDDVIPAEDDWLDQLLVGFLREKRAIVGPLLLYPDGTVQHGGLGVTKGGNVEHRYRGGSFPIDSYNYDLIFPSRVWALTGAVLLTSRELFQELGGFDESLATGWQDVDLCLRAREIGAEIIFEPRVIMTHLESVSISQELEGGAGKISHSQRTDERLLFIDRWGPFANSSYSPRISPEDPSCRTLKVAY